METLENDQQRAAANWEYMILEDNRPGIETDINRFAADGWEPATLVPLDVIDRVTGTRMYAAILRRSIAAVN